MTAITGNTYPVRRLLAGLGGIWNPRARAWMVPDERAAEARRIVDEAGPARPTSGRRPARVSNYARFSDGTEWYQNKRGRCEDAPCCGCCS